MNPTPEAKTAEQVEKFTRLQDLLLEDLTRLFEGGEVTAADRRTVYQMLRDNGWSLDPAKLPQSVKNMLTKHVAFDEDLEGDTKMRLIG